MKGIISGVVICFAISMSAQISFEKGYMINNDGQKKEVLIKHLEKINNPKDFVFKTNENSAEITYTTSNVKEFGIYNYGKFITYNGPLDYSSNKISDLSNQFSPELKETSIFLKEEVSGSKSLYSYIGGNVIKYFYSESNQTINALVYKQYYYEGDVNKVATNNTYLQQLKEIFADDEKAKSLVSKTKYATSDLTKIFKIYNQSQETNTKEENDNQIVKDKHTYKFNLNIRPGINFYAPLALNNSSFTNTEYSSRSSFRVGLEAEIILPVNRNKWSVILEPSYSVYSNKKLTNKSSELYDFSMDSYSFLNLSLGLRHHMFITEKSKIFVNVGVNVATFKLGNAENFDFTYNDESFYKVALSSTQSFQSYTLGIGYTYNNKFMVEARYNSKYNIVDNSNISKAITSDMSYFSLILGYNIF